MSVEFWLFKRDVFENFYESLYNAAKQANPSAKFGLAKFIGRTPDSDDAYLKFMDYGCQNLYVWYDMFWYTSRMNQLCSVAAGKPCYICNFKFPGEQQMNLFMAAPPKFPSSDPAAVRTIASRRYPQVQLKMAVNANLKAFYETYPLSNDFNVYSTAQFSEPNQTMIDECLRPMMRGKSQIEAANLLINLVQTGFEYKTDGDQFGRERPMFSEELFFYPYSDCEDRSALYALLVRELLDLDVVLIHYPGHLATAVCFTEPVKGGASFEYKGKTYVICDPTYIGADIGLQMPDMNKIEEVFPSNGLRNN